VEDNERIFLIFVILIENEDMKRKMKAEVI